MIHPSEEEGCVSHELGGPFGLIEELEVAIARADEVFPASRCVRFVKDVDCALVCISDRWIVVEAAGNHGEVLLSHIAD
ncbi:hypothetical protein RISK_006556 [Rhodopirellula islandica]|uniref:Uncharacterized protein n=1 Tax=Rhodopirellula islandica TaxID=595434 RepID=A0A0J1B3J5_RHOIS|nr:hypothetical protein RISK_006556 [Rhodopirellula islandica]